MVATVGGACAVMNCGDHIPFDLAQISEAEFYINGTEFKFYCKPYFLRYKTASRFM